MDKKEKVRKMIRDLSIQEIWDIQIIIAEYQREMNPEQYVIKLWSKWKKSITST